MGDNVKSKTDALIERLELDIDGERLVELFDEMISYLGMCDTERCVEILNSIGMTRSEARRLRFYEGIVEQIEEDYE